MTIRLTQYTRDSDTNLQCAHCGRLLSDHFGVEDNCDRRAGDRRINDIGENAAGAGIGGRSGIDRRGEGIGATGDVRPDDDSETDASLAYDIRISEADRAMYSRALRLYYTHMVNLKANGLLPSDDIEDVDTHISMLDGIEGDDSALHDFTL